MGTEKAPPVDTNSANSSQLSISQIGEFSLAKKNEPR